VEDLIVNVGVIIAVEKAMTLKVYTLVLTLNTYISARLRFLVALYRKVKVWDSTPS